MAILLLMLQKNLNHDEATPNKIITVIDWLVGHVTCDVSEGSAEPGALCWRGCGIEMPEVCGVAYGQLGHNLLGPLGRDES